ncbi:kelch-like ECH-associated protein 1A [Octopus bimaculoides]|uniref:BTB domain-containing protein n=1 Tax=Octopus bimaculoides TaxID=37653 RepID=A0A0L8HYJ4_OCTBM|nr:kelch-like ECH-associated protein 1A [Octopus bimaculoides]
MDPSQHRTYHDLPQHRQWRNLLSFYQKGFLCDVEFVVGNDKITAHKIILCSASNYFQVMFQSDFSEKKKNLVDFSSSFSDIRTLSSVLDYIYEGEIYLTSDTVMEILDISVQFLLPELQGHCAQFLLERLQPQNALQTWYVARLYDMRELEEVSQIVVQATFCRKFIFTKSISVLTATFLASLLHDTRLNINSVDRFEMVLWWLSYDDTTRLAEAERLISNYIRQNPLPSSYNFNETDAFDDLNLSLKTKLKDHFSPLISEAGHSLEIKRLSISDSSDKKFQWCLLVQEEGNDLAAFYCDLTKTWFLTTIFWEPGDIIGIINPHYLIHVSAKTNISLVDLSNSSSKPVSNIFRSIDKKNLTTEEDTFDIFCLDGDLYVLMTTFSGLNRKPVFVVYKYDTLSDSWNLHMEIHYEYFGDEMCPGDKASVALKVHIDLFNSYLMVTVATKRRVEVAQTAHGEYQFQELKNFHVISFDITSKKYETCGSRWHEPICLQKTPAVFLKDRICFLKYVDHKILADKFRSSLLAQEEYFMEATCLLLGDRTWEKVTIGLPAPNLPRLPIKCSTPDYDIQVTSAFDKLFVGVQRAPYVFQVAMYNLSNFSANILPYTSLPLTGNPILNVFCCQKSISTWVTPTNKHIETQTFYFTDYTIKTWQGSKRSHDKD